MKKNIGFLALDTSLLGYLVEQLRVAPPDVIGAGELSDALRDLSQGASLMLEAEEPGVALPVADRMECGDLTIFTRSRRVLRGGTEISLTPKEYDILCFLAGNRGEVFTKEQIYQAVWEGEYLLDDSNIMAFIRKLRKKIEPSPDSPRYILTIWGIGYKFNDQL